MFEDLSIWKSLGVVILIVAGIIFGAVLWLTNMVNGISRSERSENRQPESAPPPE